MFPPSVRWTLVALCLVGSALLWGRYPVSAIGLLAAGLVWAIGYWRYGSVAAASRAYRADRLDDMERLLARTAAPELLAPAHRYAYEYLSGIAADRQGDLAAARRHFFFATVARPQNRIRAQAWLQLAHTELLMGDIPDARKSLAQARALETPELAGPLMEVERAIDDAERANGEEERA